MGITSCMHEPYGDSRCLCHREGVHDGRQFLMRNISAVRCRVCTVAVSVPVVVPERAEHAATVGTFGEV